jgi:hypothetical protein
MAMRGVPRGESGAREPASYLPFLTGFLSFFAFLSLAISVSFCCVDAAQPR